MVMDAPVRRDQVSLGVLATVVGRDVVDDALAVCGIRALRSDGKLPPHVTVYLILALALFAEEDYEEVAARVTGSLDRWGCWDADWDPPTASAISQARKRLGPRVLPQVAASVFGPVGGEVAHAELGACGRARQAFACGRRLVAIDGFDLDLPDTKANAAEFGYAGSGDNRSALPKARVVTVTEAGTHAVLGAQVRPYAVGESTCARELYPLLEADQLLVADRNFFSFPDWCAAADTGAALAWRAPTGLGLPLLAVLPDGTFLSVVMDPKLRGARREQVLTSARSAAEALARGEHDHAEQVIDTGRARIVRVVEYNVADRKGGGSGEVITVVSTLTDPDEATAEEIAAAYGGRWEHENGNDELKTHLRGPAGVLRSRLPELAYQEIWALLLVHHAISDVIAQASELLDPHPDRPTFAISYTKALRLIRRTATGTAAFPP